MSLNVLVEGDGRPLLLLHGFTGSARSWWLQLDHWTQRHRVIAPDLLGHGRSDAPADARAYALERQARELVDLLQLLGAAPAAVVGYSMGARLALVLALEHAEMVDALVLESPSAGLTDDAARSERRDADARRAAAIERDGVEAFIDDWEQLPVFASQHALPDAIRERLRAERIGQRPHGLASSLRGAGQGTMRPLHDRLKRIHAPTLVVAGRIDDVGNTRARDIAAEIPGATLRVIDGAGHAPHLERPRAFTETVDAFLAVSHAPAAP